MGSQDFKINELLSFSAYKWLCSLIAWTEVCGISVSDREGRSNAHIKGDYQRIGDVMLKNIQSMKVGMIL